MIILYFGPLDFDPRRNEYFEKVQEKYGKK